MSSLWPELVLQINLLLCDQIQKLKGKRKQFRIAGWIAGWQEFSRFLILSGELTSCATWTYVMSQLLHFWNLSLYLQLHLGYSECVTTQRSPLGASCVHSAQCEFCVLIQRDMSSHFSPLICKMASALHCPVHSVLLSICQGDNFLPETPSLVIMAWDKLCWSSWS